MIFNQGTSSFVLSDTVLITPLKKNQPDRCRGCGSVLPLEVRAGAVPVPSSLSVNQTFTSHPPHLLYNISGVFSTTTPLPASPGLHPSNTTVNSVCRDGASGQNTWAYPVPPVK